MLKGAARVLTRADPDWLPPATTWREAEQRVKQKFGAGERFGLARRATANGQLRLAEAHDS